MARCVVALELLVASRALELRHPEPMGEGTARAFEWVEQIKRDCQGETGETDLIGFVKDIQLGELLHMLEDEAECRVPLL